MRIFLLSFILVNLTYAMDSVEFFNKSEKNELLCHVGQYSFKMVSQKNADIMKIHNHIFFKLKDENLYFLSNACQPIEDKKTGIIF